MIEKLTIKNFKSIRHLQLNCTRVNVFIGEPNSGKSNITEALALLSQNAFNKDVFDTLFRYKSMSDFFYDSNIREVASVNLDMPGKQFHVNILHDDKTDEFEVSKKETDQLSNIVTSESLQFFTANGSQNMSTGNPVYATKFYEYKRLKRFNGKGNSALQPPFGENLPWILTTNSAQKKWVSEFLRDKGYRLVLQPVDNDISIAKEINDELYLYPYLTISETLQRVIFLTTAIETNTDSVLVADEPEANTFPFYTKFIGERIALNEQNQFFLTTHNPYLLLNLIQKTPQVELNIMVTEMIDYQTVVHRLSEQQIEKILEYDVDLFDNLKQIIEQ